MFENIFSGNINRKSNPINRYSIGDRTQGLKYNTDGSLDIYIQHDNPEEDKVSNWHPAPDGKFDLTLRTYIPKGIVLSGKTLQ